ncbi:MAG: arsenic resistance protein [Pseudomonadota bacterium]
MTVSADSTAILDAPSGDRPAALGAAVLFMGAILVGAALGLAAPATGDVLSAGTDATLIAMISLLFFELRLRNFLLAFGNLRFLSIAWAANFLVVPLIGIAAASLFLSGQQLMFAGLMLYFLAPCTDWFLGFTRMAGGDTGLGAALIPVNMLTQLMLFPLWLWLFTEQTGLVDFAAMPGILMQWFVLPLIAAQLVRWVVKRVLSDRAFEISLDVSGRLIPLVLAVLILQIFAGNIGLIAAQISAFSSVALAVLAFFVATFFVSQGIARLGSARYPQRALLTMTMAARNAPLMIVMTAVAIPGQPLIQAIIAFGMLLEIPHLTVLRQILLRKRRAR